MFLVSYLSPAHMKVLGSKFRRYQVQTVTIIGYMISRKVRLVKAMVFLVVVYGCWEFNYKGSWVLKNWCFWTVLLEKTLESPLDFKETKPVNPEGNESWIFIGSPEYSWMLRLKLQYFRYLMWRIDSLEKTLMPGKIEGRMKRGW